MASESPRDRSVDELLKSALPRTLTAGAPDCLDAETLAAWADASLPAPAAARVEVHMSTCARCQAMAAALADAQPAIEPAAAAVPFWERWAVRWVLPAAIGASAVVTWMVIAPRDVGAPTETQMARVEPASETPAAMDRAEAGNAAQPEAAAGEQRRPAESQVPARQALPKETPATPAAALERPAPEAKAAFASTSPPSPLAAPPPAPVAVTVPPSAPAATAGRDATQQATLPQDAAVADVVGESAVARSTPPAISTSAAPVNRIPTFDVTSARNAVADDAVRSSLRDVALRTQTRWRVSNFSLVQRSFNDGRSWDVIPMNPPVMLLAGSAPSPLVCWFVGRAGVVIRTLDTQQFVRVAFPEPVDLTAVTATSETAAVVTAADGRSFETLDAGMTWTAR